MDFKIKVEVIKVYDERKGLSKQGKQWKLVKILTKTLGSKVKNINFTAFNEVSGEASFLEPGDIVDMEFSIDSTYYEKTSNWYNNITLRKIHITDKNKEIMKAVNGEMKTSSDGDFEITNKDELPF